MKPIIILRIGLAEPFKSCQEKINAAEPGDIVELTPDELEAFTTATIIQKGNPNASQLH